MRHFSKILHIGLVVMLLAGLFSCGKKADGGSAAEYGGTLVYGKNGPPITLDPAFVEETESSVIVCNLFETLILQRAGNVALDPGLARSWKISIDGKTYTFNLRTGLKFHDGTSVNAQAVVFTVDRQRKGTAATHALGRGSSQWEGFNMNSIFDDIRAVNDSTVEMKLQRPDATFLNILSLNWLAIVSPAAVEKYGADFYKNPVGAGPFKFVSWNDDGTVTAAANDDYWNGRPYLDTVIYRPVPGVHARWEALKQGTLNMMAGADQKDLTEMEKSPEFKIAKQEGMNVAYIGMNMNKKPFDNPKVREAVVLAIDRDKLVREVFSQIGRPAKNPIPPALLGYNDDIKPSPYDPDRARKLLAEAGFAKGFRFKFWGLPIARDYMPNPELAEKLILDDLKAVGLIGEPVRIASWGEYLQRRGRGEHEVSLSGWVGDAPDPHFFFYPLLERDIAKQRSSTNVAFYKSDEMHNLITRGKQTFDPIARGDIYKRACAVFNQDHPWFTIAHALQIVPMRENIMGFQMHASAIKRFEKVWIRQ